MCGQTLPGKEDPGDQESRFLPGFLPAWDSHCCPDLAEAGDEVLRPRGCRFLPVPWLSLFQPLLYFLLTASTTRSRCFQFRGEEAESQSLSNLIKTHPNTSHRVTRTRLTESLKHLTAPAQASGCFSACIMRVQHRSWAVTLGRAHCSQWGGHGRLRQGRQICVSMSWAEANEWTESP